MVGQNVGVLLIFFLIIRNVCVCVCVCVCVYTYKLSQRERQKTVMYNDFRDKKFESKHDTLTAGTVLKYVLWPCHRQSVNLNRKNP
jgi:hypothetical protein